MADASICEAKRELELALTKEKRAFDHLVGQFNAATNQKWHRRTIQVICKKTYKASLHKNLSYGALLRAHRASLIEMAEKDADSMPLDIQNYACAARTTEAKRKICKDAHALNPETMRDQLKYHQTCINTLTQFLKNSGKSQEALARTCTQRIDSNDKKIANIDAQIKALHCVTGSHKTQISFVLRHVQKNSHVRTTDSISRYQSLHQLYKKLREKQESLGAMQDKNSSCIANVAKKSYDRHDQHMKQRVQMESTVTEMKESIRALLKRVVAQEKSIGSMGARLESLENRNDDSKGRQSENEPAMIHDTDTMSKERDDTGQPEPQPRLRRPEDRKTPQVQVQGEPKRKRKTPPAFFESEHPRPVKKANRPNAWMSFLNDSVVRDTCTKVQICIRTQLGIADGERMTTMGLIPRIASALYKQLNEEQKTVFGMPRMTSQKAAILKALWANATETNKQCVVSNVLEKMNQGEKAEAVPVAEEINERVDEIMKIMQDPTLSKKAKLDELTLYPGEDVVEAKRLLKRK